MCVYYYDASVVVNITAEGIVEIVRYLMLFVVSVFVQSTALGSPPLLVCAVSRVAPSPRTHTHTCTYTCTTII